MRLGVLFSGGKDSTYTAYLAKKEGYELACLITIKPKNLDSYMFHTPNIDLTKKQAEAMDIPIISAVSEGTKEVELDDLERTIKIAKERYKLGGVVTGAIESVYQSTRIQKICNKLNLECFNPLWLKDQIELLNDLIKDRFEVIIVGVFAYPFDEKWLGKKIDKNFVKNIKELNSKYKISPSGEGGEIESFVLNCPLFKHKLEISDKKIFGEKNSWVMKLKIK